MAEQLRVLVVEDDIILKNLLSSELAHNYDLRYASDGEEALTLFEQHRPHLVLLDLVIPKVSGQAVLEQIRSRTDALKDTPVIVLSNLGQQSDIDNAKKLGATDYLVKAEVSIDEILQKIAQHLSGLQGAPAS